ISRKPKKFPLSSKKQQHPQQKINILQSKTSTKKPPRLDNQQITSNEQWENWEDSVDNNRYQQYPNDNRRQQQQQQQQQQQLHSDSLSAQKPNRFNKPISAKTRNNERQQTS
ncbi:unnamed protein product, partial [Rotaria magnacalcarata]